MMHMTFWLGFNIQDLLFHELNIATATGLLVACACAFGLAVFYESLKLSLAVVKLNAAILKAPHRQQCFSDDMVLIDNSLQTNPRRHLWTFTEVLIYAVEVTFGYIIMLLVMTYNVYLILSILLATAVCYALFGHRLLEVKMKTSKLKIPCEHCIKKDSTTSSTEIITESGNDHGDGACCSHSNSDIHCS